MNPGAYGNEVLQIQLFHLDYGNNVDRQCYAMQLSNSFRKKTLLLERRTVIVRDCFSFNFHSINGSIYLDECAESSQEGFQVRNTALYF